MAGEDGSDSDEDVVEQQDNGDVDAAPAGGDTYKRAKKGGRAMGRLRRWARGGDVLKNLTGSEDDVLCPSAPSDMKGRAEGSNLQRPASFHEQIGISRSDDEIFLECAYLYGDDLDGAMSGEDFSNYDYHDEGSDDDSRHFCAKLGYTFAMPLTEIIESLLAYWTSIRIAIAHLITWESFIVSGISTAAVIMYWKMEPDGFPLVAKLNLSFLNFVIIFPVTANIGYAFHRREQALFAIGTLKTYVTSIYIAHRDWSWPEGGSHDGRRNIKTRSPNTHGAVGGLDAGDEAEMDCGANSQEHYRQVRGVLLAMTHGMRDYLSVPLVGSKDLYLPSGKRIRKAFGPIQRNMLQFIYTQIHKLALAIEVVKEAGMPANEASRISQYVYLMMREWEHIRMIKAYRTPHGLRAFARLFIVLHGFFVGPYYAWVAGVGLDPAVNGWPFQANLGFAIALAVFTSIVIVALQNIQLSMEDPFDEQNGIDDVRVRNVFKEIERLISIEWKPGVWSSVVMRGDDLREARCKILDINSGLETIRGKSAAPVMRTVVGVGASGMSRNSHSDSFDTTHDIHLHG